MLNESILIHYQSHRYFQLCLFYCYKFPIPLPELKIALRKFALHSDSRITLTSCIYRENAQFSFCYPIYAKTTRTLRKVFPDVTIASGAHRMR